MTVRVPGDPAQPLTGRELGFQHLVGEPAQAECLGPGCGVVAEDPDPGVAEVYGSLDRPGCLEGQLACLKCPGVQGVA